MRIQAGKDVLDVFTRSVATAASLARSSRPAPRAQMGAGLAD
jgi:hypothetical protein